MELHRPYSVDTMRRQFDVENTAPDQGNFSDIAFLAVYGEFKLIDPCQAFPALGIAHKFKGFQNHGFIQQGQIQFRAMLRGGI